MILDPNEVKVIYIDDENTAEFIKQIELVLT